MQILINILLVFEVIVALLIILLVLMQRPKNEGLGAAFGGGVTDNLFGAQTTNVLQKLTRSLGIAFFALTMLLSWLYVKNTGTKTGIAKRLAAEKALATPAPAPVTSGEPAPTAASEPVKVTGTPAPASPAPAKPTPAPATPAPGAIPAPATPAPATPAPAPPAPPKPAE
ncbi:MAG: preprotein translocase subunit SecG [Chthoniobacteraceae bacterium]